MSNICRIVEWIDTIKKYHIFHLWPSNKIFLNFSFILFIFPILIESSTKQENVIDTSYKIASRCSHRSERD